MKQQDGGTPLTPKDMFVPNDVTPLKVNAYAKVNVSLEVGPVRADGYHPIDSLAMTVGLCDIISVAIADRTQDDVRVTTSTGLADTLASKAAREVLVAAAHSLPLDIHIEKDIPVGAGLGGGSADAAAVISAVAQLAEMGLSDAQLTKIAAGIGSDVPFCLAGGLAWMRGRGEILEPVQLSAERADQLSQVAILIVVPPIQCSTAAVYSAFDSLGPSPNNPEVETWLANLLPECSFRNDLTPAALVVEPELAQWQERISIVAGRPAYMSGSGSAFVSYAPDPTDLEPAAKTLRDLGAFATVTHFVSV